MEQPAYTLPAPIYYHSESLVPATNQGGLLKKAVYIIASYLMVFLSTVRTTVVVTNELIDFTGYHSILYILYLFLGDGFCYYIVRHTT